MSSGDDVRTNEEHETELVGSKSLRGAIAGSWLGTAIAVAVCAATFRPWYPGYSSLAATALVLIVSVLLVARRAAKKEGAWGVILAAVAGAGALPSFIVMSLYGATRPLMACRGIVGVDCFPTNETVLYVGAGTTILPLILSSVAATLIAKRRRRPIARVIPVVAAVGLLVATIVAVVAGSRGLRFVSGDRYLDTVPEEIGQLAGARFVVMRHDLFGDTASIDAVTTSGSSPVLTAKWSYHARGLPCELEIGGGSCRIAAIEIRKTAVGGDAEEIVCPPVRIRQDASRGLLIVDEPSPNGDFRPASSVRSEGPSGAVSGPLYVDGADLPRVAPARVWVIGAVAGVVAALGLVFVRLRSERHVVARWRVAPIGLASIERDARERRAGTLVLFSLVAFIAATPVASALFVMRN